MPPKRKFKSNGESGPAARPAKHTRQAGGNAIPTNTLAVYTLGTGGAGELGFGPTPPLPSDAESATQLRAPLLNPALSGVVQLSTGGMHCAALTAGGKILTWGANDTGNLGRDTAWKPEDLHDHGPVVNPLDATPMEVNWKCFGASGKRPDFVQVVATDNATFGLATDGKVWGWGSFRDEKGLFGFIKANLDGHPNPTDADKIQLKPTIIPGLPGNVKQLAGNTDHMLALTHSSQIWAWGGSSSCCELGRRIRSTRSVSRHNSLVPTRVALPRSASREIRGVYAGSHHSFAVDGDGRLFAWGANHFGQTGVVVARARGDDECVAAPTLVSALAGRDVVHVAGGTHHSVACDADGNVWVWGRCDEGQAGLDLAAVPGADLERDSRGRPAALRVPTVVPGLKARHVAAGVDCTFAVTPAGRVYAWGYADGYRLGLPSETNAEEPARLNRDARLVSIQKRVFSWAGCGGQFGVIAGPVANDTPVQDGVDEAEDGRFAEQQNSNHQDETVTDGDHTNQNAPDGYDDMPHLDDAGSGSSSDSSLHSLSEGDDASDQNPFEDQKDKEVNVEIILIDGFADQDPTDRDSLHYLIDNSNPEDHGGDDDYSVSSDGGSFAPAGDDGGDSDMWMSSSSSSSGESEESDKSSSGGAPLASSSSESDDDDSHDEDDTEDSTDPSTEDHGDDFVPTPLVDGMGEPMPGLGQHDQPESDDSSMGGAPLAPTSSEGAGSGSSEEDIDNTTEYSSENSTQEDDDSLPSPEIPLVDAMGLPIPGLGQRGEAEGGENSNGSSSIPVDASFSESEEESHSEKTTGDSSHGSTEGYADSLSLPRRPLVDGMGVPIPGLGHLQDFIVDDQDEDDAEDEFVGSTGHSHDDDSSEQSMEDSSDPSSQEAAGPLPAPQRPLVDGMGVVIPGLGLYQGFVVDDDEHENSEDEYLGSTSEDDDGGAMLAEADSLWGSGED